MRRFAAALLALSSAFAAEFSPGTSVNFLRNGGVVLAGTADMNRDGLADIIGVSTVNNTVAIRISAPGGVDSTREIALPAVGRPVDLLLGDISGDVEPDIAVLVVNGNTQANLCFIAGSRTQNYGAPNCTAVPSTLTPSNALRVFLVRVPPPTLPTAPAPPPQQMLMVVDGPRGLLLAANPTGSGVTFTNQPIVAGFPIDHAVVADLNGDGSSDLVLSSNAFGLYAMNLINLLRGLVSSTRLDPAAGPVAAADFDQDGSPEIAVLDRDNGRVRLFTRSTASNITGISEYREVGTGYPVEGLPSTGRQMFLTDIDRDNRADLVVRSTTGLTLLRGGATRYEFIITPNIAPVLNAANLSGFSIVDVNGDNQTDLVYAADNGDTNPAASSVILHTGRPSFTETLIELSPTAAEIGQQIRLTARVNNASPTGGFGAFGGTIRFLQGETLIDTIGISAPTAAGDRSLGVATLQRTFPAGTYEIRAVYSGSTGFLTSTSRPATLSVRGGTSELRISNLPPPILRGDPFSLIVDVSAPGVTNITGTVTAFLASAQIARADVQNGRASLALPTSDLPLGPIRLRLRYEGPALPPAEIEPNLFVNGRLTVVNAASYAQVIVPDSIAVLQAPGLRAPQVTAQSLPWPTELGGVSIELRDSSGNAVAGRLYYAGPNQVNFLVPPGLNAGAGELRLQFPGSPFIATPIRIQRTQPGIFTANSDGRGVAAAIAIRVAPDGTQTPVAVFQCNAQLCQPIPMELNSTDQVIVSLYGTGWRTAAVLNTAVDNRAADMLFGGAHPTIPGLDQINFRVPAGLRGEVDVVVFADGVESNRARLSFR